MQYSIEFIKQRPLSAQPSINTYVHHRQLFIENMRKEKKKCNTEVLLLKLNLEEKKIREMKKYKKMMILNNEEEEKKDHKNKRNIKKIEKNKNKDSEYEPSESEWINCKPLKIYYRWLIKR